MSATQLKQARPAAGRPAAALPPLITGPLLARFVSVIGAETSFFLPLSVVPGMGAGAAVIGLLAATVGYPPASVITAALVLPALVLVLRERRPQVAPVPPPPATQE